MHALLREVDWSTSYPLRDFSALELEDPSDPHREKRDGRNLGKVDQWGPEDEARQSEMMRRVSVAKLERTASEGRPEADAAAVAREQFRQYQAACALYRKHLQETEEGANDDLVIVAAHHLLAAGRAVDAMAVCVAGLEHTKYAFQPKLLLVRQAARFGAFSFAAEQYRLLDCKYVQFDSLGHYALYPAVQGGDVGWLEQVCRSETDYRDQAIKRSVPADTAKCFSHGKWSQVEGFLHFAQRVDGSWHAAACRVELLLAQLLGARADEEGARAVLAHGRQRGRLETGRLRSPQWIEAVAEACRTCRGKEDMRLVYNYDTRVQADYTVCRTKAEFAAHEWEVPRPMLEWLEGRAQLLLFAEASLAGNAPALAAAADRLQQLAEPSRAAGVLGGPVSWELLRRVAHAGAAVAAGKGSETMRAIDDVAEQLREAQLQLVTQKNDVAFPCLEEGWAAELSFIVFQVVPLLELVLGGWRRSSQPSKSAQKKLSAEARAELAELLALFKACGDQAAQTVRASGELCKCRLAKTDDEALEWMMEQLTCHISDKHLATVAQQLNASWKTLFTNVAAARK